MSIALAALFAAVLGVASAMVTSVPASEALSILPSQADTYLTHENGYTYHVYHYQGKEYIYTYSSCSTPPSSIEVCLSSIFTSIEGDISIIEKSLMKHEVSMHGYMKYEASILETEITNLHEAYKIAQSVKEAVSVDYDAEKVQINDLKAELVQIKAAKAMFSAQLDYIQKEVIDIEQQYSAIYDEYLIVKKAKWSLVTQIQGIQKEKALIVKEQADVQAVVSELNEQIDKIHVKVSEMNKRQKWMASWEDKLSVNLQDFVEELNEFKSVEKDLVFREKYLKKEQASLYQAVEVIEEQIMKLKVHYQKVAEYLSDFEMYEKEIQKYQHYVSYDATEFSYALSEFSCEESLLHYEACSSSAAAVVAAAPVAPAKGATVPAAKNGVAAFA